MGVMVTYSDGEQCTGGPKRQTLIYVSCNKSADPGYFYEAEEGDCSYVLKMWSAAGCGVMVR
jgi:hypothetical protein